MLLLRKTACISQYVDRCKLSSPANESLNANVLVLIQRSDAGPSTGDQWVVDII